MERKRFTTNDAGFVCGACGLEVLPLGNTSRNHCPRCLTSRHLDVNPGDRACECRGLMRPIGVEKDGKRGFLLVHRCERCGVVRRNRAATDARVQPDSMERIIELSASAAMPAEGIEAAPRRRTKPRDSRRAGRR